MTYSKDIISFVDSLINNYGKIHSLDGFYTLTVYLIPDFDVAELIALMMIENDDAANEATSCDNPSFEKLMKPALINYMKNSTSKDAEIEFKTMWREGLYHYFEERIQTLIDERLEIFNEDHGCTRSPSYTYGVPAHGSL